MNAVALVPALDEADRVGHTVRALSSVPGIGEVLVVDAGSTDGTARAASEAGARVLVSPARLGKGEALEAAVASAPEAEVYVLADADLGRSAGRIGPLLEAVASGRADMAVGVLPRPPSGGFGLVKGLAGRLVRMLTGRTTREPLSGQRAVTGRCLRACRPLARGFGVEVALTADAARLGFSILEIEIPLEHRYTRKDVAGFLHRGRQGIDALRAAAPRLLRLR